MNCQADMPAGARRPQLVPPRQAEIAGHRADQDAERQDPLGDLRHAEERGLGDHQAETFGHVASAPHHLDVVDQHDQHEHAEEHRDQRAEEAHAEIADERARSSRGSCRSRRRSCATHALNACRSRVVEEGRRLDDQRRARSRRRRRRRAAHRKILDQHGRAGISGVNTVQAKPISRSVATRDDHHDDRPCRGFAAWCAARRGTQSTITMNAIG